MVNPKIYSRYSSPMRREKRGLIQSRGRRGGTLGYTAEGHVHCQRKVALIGELPENLRETDNALNLRQAQTMRLLLGLIALSLGAAACATKPAPPLFQGSSGWNALPNTTKLVAKTAEPGELIAEREIKFRRTGTLKTDVKNMLGIVKMKAGSPVYAVSYAGQGKNYSALAWCAPAGSKNNVGSFLTGENDVECLMFDKMTGRAVRTDGAGGSRFFARTMKPTSTSIAVPEIEEGPVDFGRRLTLRLSVDSLTGKTMDGIEMFHDGEDQTLLKRTNLKWDENGVANWMTWGGQLRLTRTGPEDNYQVSIEQIRPFTDGGLSRAQLLKYIQALQQQKSKPAARSNPED